MLELSTYTVIMALSGLVIVSYVFSLVSAKTRIPTVLMLLLLGMGIREFLIRLDTYQYIPLSFIQFFGVLGLILILLEAGLDLNMSKDKLPLIRRAAASSVFMLILSAVGIAAVIQATLDQSWRVSLAYAVPLSVISSTVVASSVNYLNEAKREFLTYESSLSDIMGILLFNFLVADKTVNMGLIVVDVAGIVIALAVSVVVSVVLMFLLTRVDINIKAFLIFAVLLMLYSAGHIWHIPTLLAVLVFGLIINNWRGRYLAPLRKRLHVENVEHVTETVKSVTSESAFLIRTLFFTLFGYMINVHMLFDGLVIVIGTAIVLVIYLVRFLYLRLFVRDHILPELFFSPRGLVTIVLFYSIPIGMTFDTFDDGILFYVIVLTILIMMFGSMWFTPKESTRQVEETARRRLGKLFSNRPDVLNSAKEQ